MTSAAVEPGAAAPGDGPPGGVAPVRRPPRPRRRPRADRSPVALAALGSWVVVVAALAVAVWARRWISDDGFINLRIVDNVLDGHGPVFNPGERVEAGTSQLWLAVLVVARALLGWAVELEWLAVWAGILTSLAAVVVVARGQWRVWGGPVLPAGILAWVALPAVWDFSTSGLEGPLLWCWQAVVFAAVARRAVAGPVPVPPPAPVGPGDGGDATAAPAATGAAGAAGDPVVVAWRAAWDPWWLPVLIGLGPLIRPDAAVYSLAAAVALLWCSSRSWTGVLSAAALAAAVPAAYQVFRMGFFAVLLPNTALAKEAGDAQWSTGARYLGDFVATQALWLPLAAAAGLAAWLLAARLVPRRLAGVWALTAAGGVVHAVWVVRVGGDFMHARLLLADLFAVLLPVAAVPLVALRRAPAVVAVVVLALWSLWAAVGVAPRFESAVAPGVFDERENYERGASHPHPVTLEDHGANLWTVWGRQAARRSAAGEDVVLWPSWDQDGARPLRSTPSSGGTYLVWPNIGMMGYAAGPDVHVVDAYGLADPVASRLSADADARAGHAKSMSPDWVVGRFGAFDEPLTDGAAAARRTLACPQLQELLDATGNPVTPRRFAANVVRSPSLTALRIPDDPVLAERRFCAPR